MNGPIPREPTGPLKRAIPVDYFEPFAEHLFYPRQVRRCFDVYAPAEVISGDRHERLELVHAPLFHPLEMQRIASVAEHLADEVEIEFELRADASDPLSPNRSTRHNPSYFARQIRALRLRSAPDRKLSHS